MPHIAASIATENGCCNYIIYALIWALERKVITRQADSVSNVCRYCAMEDGVENESIDAWQKVCENVTQRHKFYDFVFLKNVSAA